MRDEILDVPKIHQKRSVLFSKLSFFTALFTVFGFLYLMAQIPKRITVSEGITSPPRWVVIIVLFSCLMGVVFTAISIARKEQSKFYKWVGAVINIILFLLIFGSIVFANVVDRGLF